MTEIMSAMERRRRILTTSAFFALVSVACTNFETLSRPNYGYIRVTVVSTGGDLDIDGYYLVVDARQIAQLPVSPTPGSFYVPSGEHAVTLQNVADNCVVQGSNTRTVSVETGLISDVKFDVTCTPTGIVVTTRTSGIDTPESLQLTLLGRPAVTIASSGSFTIGRLAAGAYVVAVVPTANCSVAGGGQAAVTVTPGAVSPVSFDVTCGAAMRTEKIAFVDDQTSAFSGRYLMLANPDGTGLTRLRDGMSPSWSPDRTRLAYSTTTCDDSYWYYYYGRPCSGSILLVDPETGNVTLTSSGYAYEPSWAPNGAALVLEGFGERKRDLKLHVMQMSTGSISLLDIKGPASSEQPAWSPDGTRIAFVCRWSVNTDLCIVNADGSGLVQLTNDLSADLHPAWSPNGNSIAFARHPFDRTDPISGDIVVMDIATRATTVLTKGTEPTWSPDGSRLAFAGGGGLFVIDAVGTNLKRITTGDHREPAWRP